MVGDEMLPEKLWRALLMSQGLPDRELDLERKAVWIQRL